MPSRRSTILILVMILLAACASNPATPTLTPTPANTPTVTPIPKTPTPKIPEPSVPHGLRSKNAATQTFEKGTWVVKNADGQVTATWNTETNSWDYSTVNIDVAYTQIGLNVDQSLIEPLLGPLPPDDPSTHFIDPATVESVAYGVGLEAVVPTQGTAGVFAFPATEFFARFGGIVTVSEGPDFSAMVFEIPSTADTSTIIVMRIFTDSFVYFGLPDNSIMYDHKTLIPPSAPRTEWIQIANDHFIGQMVMFIVMHNRAETTTGTSIYDRAVKDDEIIVPFLDYLTGKSTRIPRYELNDDTQSFMARIIVPARLMPQE